MSNDLVISDLTLDFDQFVGKFQESLGNRTVWKGNLTTQTSQTIIELISAVGTFNAHRSMRHFEDAFSETAQSDDAIRAITQMQGIRMSRRLPASLTATVTSSIEVTLNPLTQFMIGGKYYFNRVQLTFEANVAQTITLFQGQVHTYAMNGLGTPRQTFISEEDSFAVSDSDVRVYVNNTAIPKCFGALWNYANLPAFGDLTTADGRLLIVFGSEQFGTTPIPTDVVVVQYVTTQGEDGVNQTLVNRNVEVDGIPNITGKVLTNPTGGGNEQPIQVYKNLSSGAFGTYSSGVTKSQYYGLIGTYPGIIDAVTLAQREINPMALEWMNVIRISALTNTPWSEQQKQDFMDYVQSVTMYAPRFVWQDPIPVYRDIELTIHCFNTAVLSKVQADCEEALYALFSPRSGLMMTNFYGSDLTDVCKKAGKGAVSYVTIKNPVDPMIVTEPVSPIPEFEIIPGGGTLGELVYAYGIAIVDADGEGHPTNWVFPQIIGDDAVNAIKITWPPMQNVTAYKVYGRKGGSIGLLATINADQPLEFVDDGSVVPSGSFVSAQNLKIRYNAIRSLTVHAVFAERQQRLGDTPIRGLT